MKKINKKSIVFTFKILSILAFSLLIIPAEASADIAGYVTSYDSTSFNGGGPYNNQYYNYYQPPIYTPPPAVTITPIVYSNSTNPNVTSTTTAPRTVAKAKTTSTTNSNNNTYGGLASSVILGSNSFLPSRLSTMGLVCDSYFAIDYLGEKNFWCQKKL